MVNVRPTEILALALLAALAPACGGGSSGGGGGGSFTTPGWVNQQRIPTASHLNGASFANALQGIIVGDATSIYRTDDGGITWMQQEHNPKSSGGDILCMDAQGTTVHSGGSDASGARAWVTDNTIEWFTSATPGTPPIIAGVDVVREWDGISTSIAFYMRQNGDIVPSGAAFTTTRAPFAPDATSTGARAIDYLGLSGIGFVCGTASQVFTTNNFGSTWTPNGVWTTVSYSPSYPQNPSYSGALVVDFNDILMTGPSSGIMCGASGTVATTIDGVGWVRIPGSPVTTETLRSIIMVTGTLGWACGTNGTIVKLTAAGTPPVWTWTVQNSGTTQQLNEVSMVDANVGYAVGQNGTVVKTTDGGATPWVLISGGSQAQINAMDFTADGQTGLAVGNGSVVLRTLNGGTTWSTFNTGVPASTNLHGVCIPRNGTGTRAYLVGANGTLRFQADLLGAAAWTAPTGSTAGANLLRAVHFPNGDVNGVAVGDGGTIVRTIDSGANWINDTTAPNPAATGYYALAANPAGTTLYVSGTTGIISASTDNGDTWANIVPALGASTTLTSIQAPSGTNYTLFVAAANQNVYRLTAGMTPAWQTTTPLAPNIPVSIAFDNDATGWAVLQGAGAGIFRTDDGGTSWSALPEHTKSVFNVIRMISSSTGWTGGNDGTILKTTSGGN